MDLEIELLNIINDKNITTVFQPIVSLNDGNILGYEALSRGPNDSLLFSPDKLFSAAEKYNKTWQLDSLCRIKAIEKAKSIGTNKFLFLNVDPMIIKDQNFIKGFTKEFLLKNNISPENIIFEITEKTAIQDYTGFKNILSNYIEQGYKIAIDDTGAGYSGLKTISETKPHYIKIDMDLVSNIDKEPFKQALMKTFVTLSNETGMKIIAEGIETEEELKMLINLGVYAGQGFYLQRPASNFLDIPDKVKSFIITHSKLKNNNFNIDKHFIGEIVSKNKTFNANSTCNNLINHFKTSIESGVCITNFDYPVGLVMRNCLDAALATQYGVAIFSRRSISLVMDNNPLIVDYYTRVNTVSNQAMNRDDKRIYDHVIVIKEGKYYGIVTIKDLLLYTTRIEKNYAKELNPLTGLPGNTIIESNLKDILKGNEECCLLYFDLDNFKIYNDVYGFENGDKVLKFTARVIENSIDKLLDEYNFVGHIGGDDFVCIIKNSFDNNIKLCKEIIKNFDASITNFFNEKDKQNGYIQSLDRKGTLDKFNLTSMSIAGLYGNFSNLSSTDEIGILMSKIKKKVKEIKNSSFRIENMDHLKSDEEK